MTISLALLNSFCVNRISFSLILHIQNILYEHLRLLFPAVPLFWTFSFTDCYSIYCTSDYYISFLCQNMYHIFARDVGGTVNPTMKDLVIWLHIACDSISAFFRRYFCRCPPFLELGVAPWVSILRLAYYFYSYIASTL